MRDLCDFVSEIVVVRANAAWKQKSKSTCVCIVSPLAELGNQFWRQAILKFKY